MRTTIDMPDALFRRTKALAATRGTSLKSLIIAAVEREVTESQGNHKPARKPPRPYVHLSPGRKLDLTGFDFDDLLT